MCFTKENKEESTMDVEMNINELVILLNGVRNTSTGEDRSFFLIQ